MTMTTVQDVMWRIEELNSFLDDLDKNGGITFEEANATRLSEILEEYRDMLATMKVKTN